MDLHSAADQTLPNFRGEPHLPQVSFKLTSSSLAKASANLGSLRNRFATNLRGAPNHAQGCETSSRVDHFASWMVVHSKGTYACPPPPPHNTQKQTKRATGLSCYRRIR